MRRAANDLKIWAKSLFSDAKVQFHLACEVVLRLNSNCANTSSKGFWALLLSRELERDRPPESPSSRWVTHGLHFLQAKINSRRRKNFIHSLETDNATVTTHEEKADAAHSHFSNLLGKKEARRCSINWDEIDMPTVQNEGLDNPFSEAEVWAAIMASPADRAPGPV